MNARVLTSFEVLPPDFSTRVKWLLLKKMPEKWLQREQCVVSRIEI
jgi:hypothetical protein